MKRLTFIVVALLTLSAFVQSCKLHAPYRNPHPAQRFAVSPAASHTQVKG